jgi:hypothetical protein
VRRGDATESSLTVRIEQATHGDEEWAGGRVEIITLLLLPCTSGQTEGSGGVDWLGKQGVASTRRMGLAKEVIHPLTDVNALLGNNRAQPKTQARQNWMGVPQERGRSRFRGGIGAHQHATTRDTSPSSQTGGKVNLERNSKGHQ